MLKIIKGYFRERKRDIILFIIGTVIFLTVFYLYSQPVYAVVYAAVLTMTVFIIIGVIDFIFFYKKNSTLMSLRNEIDLRIDNLPQASGVSEENYQNLIKIVHEEKCNYILKSDMARRDTIDYYTMWAHQIKTPIAAMKLLMQCNETEENKELLQELFKIEQYVDMVLQFIRLDAPTTDYKIKKYDLDLIVRQAVRKYAPVFIRKKLSMNYEELNCKVLTDEKWLLFVIEQIISNAVKYTKSGSIHIYMEETNIDTAKNILVIEDTGIGIQEEDINRIFEKGYTGYNGRKDKKSTGIGLYLCKKILYKLSHTIQVDSEAGKGTAVKICFFDKDMVHE